MKQSFSLYKLVALLPILFLYNNCDGFKSVSDGGVGSSTTCKLSKKSSLKLAGFDSQKDCQNFSEVICESRVFSPDVENGQQTKEVCSSSSEYGNPCFEITQRNYNTEGAQGEDEDYLEGGSYNYTEFNCYNKKFQHNNEAIFQSSAPSLEGALEQLYQKCQKKEVL